MSERENERLRERKRASEWEIEWERERERERNIHKVHLLCSDCYCFYNFCKWLSGRNFRAKRLANIPTLWLVCWNCLKEEKKPKRYAALLAKRNRFKLVLWLLSGQAWDKSALLGRRRQSERWVWISKSGLSRRDRDGRPYDTGTCIMQTGRFPGRLPGCNKERGSGVVIASRLIRASFRRMKNKQDQLFFDKNIMLKKGM